MRIGVSLLSFRPGKVGGIETYIRKVVEHAPLLAGNDEIVFFVTRANRQVVADDLDVVVVDYPQPVLNAFRILEAFTPWRARSVERQIIASGVDVMLYTQQTMFPKQSIVPSVLLVADVQYLISPQYYSWFDRQFRKKTYLPSMIACSKISAISEFTAGHLVAH